MLVFALLACVLIYAESATNNYSLMFISGACSGEEFDTGNLLPAAKLAMKKVFLTYGHQLYFCFENNLQSNNVQSQSSHESVLDILDSNPNCSNVSTIIHPGCSEDTDNIIHLLAKRFSKPILVTYTFSSVSWGRLMYESHFHMLPGHENLAVALSGVVASFSWTRLVIITQNLTVFTMISGTIKDSFRGDVTESIYSLNDNNQLLFPQNHRIFILNMYPAYARAVLCEAYKKKLFYPGYVWITYGWHQGNDWWNTEDSRNSCSANEIGQVLIGAIALSLYPVLVDEEVTSNFTDMYSRLVYDAVLAFGSCLNKIQDGSTLNDAFQTLNITGMSGPILFSNGFRYIEDIQILQYREDSSTQELQMQPVASVSVLGLPNVKFLTNESISTLWPAGLPHDGTPRQIESYPLLSLMVICYTYATAGICFAIVCLIFNVVFRNKKLVRLASPNINYFIITGAIVFYLSVYTYFYVPQTSLEVVAIVCNFRLWLTSFGFSLCYVPINVKMWRVYHICRKPRPSMKNLFLRDWHLVAILFAFIFLDLLILVSVTSITGSRFTVIRIKDKENPEESVDEDGYAVVSTVKRCHSSTEIYWITVLFAYKFVLQGIGVFLAFSIRKVKIKGLNESREVSAILYTTTVITVAVCIVTLVFGDYINVDGGTYGLGISTATTLVLVFLFIPKMYGLYKDPKGEKVFMAHVSEKHSNSVTARSQMGTTTGKITEVHCDTQTAPEAHKNKSEIEMTYLEKSEEALSCDNANTKMPTISQESI